MATKMTVEGAGGVPLHVRSDGDDDRDALLLVHGTIGSSGDWALVTPHLVEDYRVVSYDRVAADAAATATATATTCVTRSSTCFTCWRRSGRRRTSSLTPMAPGWL